MINYKEFEESVYYWLKEKNNKDESFCFSTRRKAAKGAEKNYFIGTQKSNYFGTTLWWIPTYYPGSSSDLINIIFTPRDNKYHAYIQFTQTKQPSDKQNELALQFIQELRNFLLSKDIKLGWNADDGNKMEYFNIILCNTINTLEEFFKILEIKLNEIISLVDAFLNVFKKEHEDFDAGRISKDMFQNVYQKRLKERLKKYENIKVDPIQVYIDSEPNELKAIIPPFPLNLILYGPPGTGKTYASLEKAVEIADNEFYKENNVRRLEISEKFSDLLIREMDKESDAQIAFCTFHQSMTYEDFIEGIKPVTINNQVQYEITDGIFKKVSGMARNNWLASRQNVGVVKPDFELALEHLKSSWNENREMKFSLQTKGYEFTITEITEHLIRFRKASGGTGHTLSLNTLQLYFYDDTKLNMDGVGRYYKGVLDALTPLVKVQRERVELKNYVIMIDEINRGNVSQIFGELITCIESTKRTGNREENIEVLLPYSKVAFSVPPNLYIIGTMNTADRSVEALDTALRRRFEFEEMLPDYDLITPPSIIIRWRNKNKENELNNTTKKIDNKDIYQLFDIQDTSNEQNLIELLQLPDGELKAKIQNEEYIKFKGIGFDKLLKRINNRIEILLSKDHLIGHSFFINVFSLEELKRTFYKNIIPLLQEYFYGDYGKIGLVLGGGFVRQKESTNVKFATYQYDNQSELYRTVYEIIPISEIDIKNAINVLMQNE